MLLQYCLQIFDRKRAEVLLLKLHCNFSVLYLKNVHKPSEIPVWGQQEAGSPSTECSFSSPIFGGASVTEDTPYRLLDYPDVSMYRQAAWTVLCVVETLVTVSLL